jgi:hypothetical protein
MKHPLTLPALLLASALAAAPPKEEPVPWTAGPDPLPWKMQATAREGKFIQLKSNGSMVFPTTPSPFVLIITPGGKGELNEYKVVDLRSLEPVGKVVKSDKVDHRFIKLSPWGDAMVSIDPSAPKATLTLWSFTDEAVLPSVAVDDEKMKIDGWDFAGKGYVLSVKDARVKEKGQKPSRLWQTWDVRTGKPGVSFQHPLEYHVKWISFSPARRYLVMQETGSHYELLFWDLTSGKLAGKIEMQGPRDQWGQCGSITFSPDGKEAALTWRLHKDGVLAKIMRFDVEKGTKLGEHKLGKEVEPSDASFLAGGPQTLQFLPDGRGWLLGGHQVLERETGAVVWAIPPSPRFSGDTRDRRWADPYHVSTPRREKKLSLIALPKGELDAAFRKARDGRKPGG